MWDISGLVIYYQIYVIDILMLYGCSILIFLYQDVIERVVSVARNTADDLIRSEGLEVTVAEDPDLQLPFLLPEDGYSCDGIENIPQGESRSQPPLSYQ